MSEQATTAADEEVAAAADKEATAAADAKSSLSRPQLLVEVRPDPNAGNLRPGDVLQDLNARIGDVTSSILVLAERMQGDLAAAPREANWGLDSVSIKLALELSADAGVVVARAGGKATFEVTLSWAR